MRRPVVSSLLVLTALAISVSVVYAEPREEMRLTTIIPDQQVLRVKKGIVSTTNYRQADYPDTNIPANSLFVEGNVGIGTTNPQAPAPNSLLGNLDVNDVYLRGAGKWASKGMGGYVSDWRSISAGGSATFNHNLGTDKLLTTVQFKPTVSGAISEIADSEFAGCGYGAAVTFLNTSQITITGGNAGLTHWTTAGGITGDASSTGYVRVLITALE